MQNAHYKLWASEEQLITVPREAKSTECEQTEPSDAGDGMRHTNGGDKRNEKLKVNVRTWTKSSSSPRSMFALWILCRFFRILTDGVQWYGERRKAGKYAKSQRCKVSISCIHYSSSSSTYQTRSLSFHFARLISLVTRHIPQGEGNKTKKPRYLARPHICYGIFQNAH